MGMKGLIPRPSSSLMKLPVHIVASRGGVVKFFKDVKKIKNILTAIKYVVGFCETLELFFFSFFFII